MTNTDEKRNPFNQQPNLPRWLIPPRDQNIVAQNALEEAERIRALRAERDAQNAEQRERALQQLRNIERLAAERRAEAARRQVEAEAEERRQANIQQLNEWAQNLPNRKRRYDDTYFPENPQGEVAGPAADPRNASVEPAAKKIKRR